eukprot:CAMPEP_0184188840 /NCGR_PEP_ID=MMETSP0976-20121227/1651_1 /TAXON_ID=483370 /ORGANISM="non described non described, Strain CCMP2097" /LENGTH=302 /DNA_ID=CAMNT_0026493185 /DNA_START=86 /DNA_END=996 /DNA_ORIENTATION=+
MASRGGAPCGGWRGLRDTGAFVGTLPARAASASREGSASKISTAGPCDTGRAARRAGEAMTASQDHTVRAVHGRAERRVNGAPCGRAGRSGARLAVLGDRDAAEEDVSDGFKVFCSCRQGFGVAADGLLARPLQPEPRLGVGRAGVGAEQSVERVLLGGLDEWNDAVRLAQHAAPRDTFEGGAPPQQMVHPEEPVVDVSEHRAHEAVGVEAVPRLAVARVARYDAEACEAPREDEARVALEQAAPSGAAQPGTGAQEERERRAREHVARSARVEHVVAFAAALLQRATAVERLRGVEHALRL